MKAPEQAAAVTRDVAAFVDLLRKRMDASAVLLFGSHARGDWRAWSDVDLLVLSDDLAQTPYLARLERLFALWAEVSLLGADVLGLTPAEFARRAQELSIIGEIAREAVVVYSAPGWVRPAARPVRVPSSPDGAGGT